MPSTRHSTLLRVRTGPTVLTVLTCCQESGARFPHHPHVRFEFRPRHILPADPFVDAGQSIDACRFRRRPEHVAEPAAEQAVELDAVAGENGILTLRTAGRGFG